MTLMAAVVLAVAVSSTAADTAATTIADTTSIQLGSGAPAPSTTFGLPSPFTLPLLSLRYAEARDNSIPAHATAVCPPSPSWHKGGTGARPSVCLTPRRLQQTGTPLPLLLGGFAPLLFFLSLVCHMMAGQGRNVGPQGHDAIGSGNLRQPPAWSPQMESTYPFRHYSRDLLLWSLATDLQPHQQASAVILRLGGQAREIAREITPEELVNGGMIDGVQVDPLAFLIRGLQTRFAPLGEETALRLSLIHI